MSISFEIVWYNSKASFPLKENLKLCKYLLYGKNCKYAYGGVKWG